MAGAESGVINDRRMHHNRQATPDNRAVVRQYSTGSRNSIPIIYLLNDQRNRQNIIVKYNLTPIETHWLSSTA
jgi:hypothetical protein